MVKMELHQANPLITSIDCYFHDGGRVLIDFGTRYGKHQMPEHYVLHKETYWKLVSELFLR